VSRVQCYEPGRWEVGMKSDEQGMWCGKERTW
jgi:hypothetical protein